MDSIPTMMRDAAISFPMLGDWSVNFPASFEVFGFRIYLYGVVMAIAFIVAVLYAAHKAPKVGIKGDDIYSLVLWVLPMAIIGCRLYYVASEWDRYKDNLIEILYIRDGGIAMYGGIIAGVITVYIWSRAKKIPVGATLDIAGSALILGQVIGRWANFVNREAFGYQTDIFCRMGLTRPGEATVYVHPTFLYESLWNLAGFLIINFFWLKKDRRKYDGQVFIFYAMWYGAGRSWIEGLRTDSLYIPGTDLRVSQVVAAVSMIAGLIILLYNSARRHREPYVLRAAAAAAAPAAQAADTAAEAPAEGAESEPAETAEAAAPAAETAEAAAAPETGTAAEAGPVETENSADEPDSDSAHKGDNIDKTESAQEENKNA